MQNNFENSLLLVLKSEGGFVNDPRDTGGITNLGVTQATWSEWVGHTATEAEMRALTPDRVYPLYKARYWLACYGPQLPLGIDYMVLDCAVNAGPGRAIKLLQEAMGCVPDGIIGPRTMQLIDQKDPKDVIEAYSNRKKSYYEGLKLFPVFGEGWLKRVEEVKQNALKMIGTTND